MMERDLKVADKETAESAMEEQVQAVSNSDYSGTDGVEQHAFTNIRAVEKIQKYPNEVWGLVFQRLESVRDFARIQRVSKTFYTLIHLNSWTKIHRIEIISLHFRGANGPEVDAVKAKVFTGVQEQRLALTAHWVPLPLQTLIQKATNTAVLHLDLAWVKGEGRDQILADLLGTLATSLTKIEELKLKNVPSLPLQPSQALALFLTTNAESLTRLTMDSSFGIGEDVPGELLEAFQNLSSLDYLEIMGSSALLDCLLSQKPHLKALVLFTDPIRSIATLLRCRAKLDYLSCLNPFLIAYLRELPHQNCSLAHPLESVKLMKLSCLLGLSSLPWALLPNLSLLSCNHLHAIGNMADLLPSFLLHWSAAGVPKLLECRIENIVGLSSEEVTRMAGMVMRASQCQAMVHHKMRMQHQEHTLEFHKECAMVKVLIGHR